jgi:hypothetical protein
MGKRALVLLLIFGLAAGRPLAAQLKVAEKDLAEKYREWLKLTAYIILPVEREVFLKLERPGQGFLSRPSGSSATRRPAPRRTSTGTR